jgi:hypothetical protein
MDTISAVMRFFLGINICLTLATIGAGVRFFKVGRADNLFILLAFIGLCVLFWWFWFSIGKSEAKEIMKENGYDD